MHRSVFAILALLPALFLSLSAAEPAATPYKANVKPASNEAIRAMQRIRIPQGMKIDLWVAEPLLANPVVFSIDFQNRIYVAETFRLHASPSRRFFC